MESFQWNKHFETGLETIDQQHHGLVDLINRFGELLVRAEGASAAEIDAMFKQLAAYAQYHFHEEEQLMQKVGLDPGYIKQHRKLHTDFVQDLTVMHQRATERQETAEQLLKFLTYWLTYHILGTDQSMAKQMVAVRSGQAPKDALDTEANMQKGATGPLLQALNGLFHQVSERNRELQELNRSLELKVAERTRSLSDANQLLEQLALTDVLTGLPNRRQAMATLDRAWAQAVRDASALSCMMIDADGFKQVNDRYGHAAGDEVLRQLSALLRDSVRRNDIVCRLGGDEFLILCPGTTLEGALQGAEILREKTAKLQVPVNGGEWLGSISIGVAARTPAMQDFEALIKTADEGLYLAKRNGRNGVASGNTVVL
jgi:hemerythrin